VVALCAKGTNLFALSAGNNGTSSVQVSADNGLSWVQKGPTNSPNWRGIAATATAIAAVMATGPNCVWTSADNGATWSNATTPSMSGSGLTIGANATVFAVLTTSDGMYSADGKNWTSATNPLTEAPQGPIVWNGTLFLAKSSISNKYVTSPDAKTWTVHTGPSTTATVGVKGATFIWMANDGNCYTSTDGANWIAHPLPVAAAGFAFDWVTATGSAIVAQQSATGTVYYCTDFTAWTWTRKPSLRFSTANNAVVPLPTVASTGRVVAFGTLTGSPGRVFYFDDPAGPLYLAPQQATATNSGRTAYVRIK
jgi:hypothetical protein